MARIKEKISDRSESGSIGARFSRAIVLWTIFRLSVANLLANKLRTALTLVGIIIGVAAMISVVTIIKGLDATVASTFSKNGSTVFTLAKGPTIVTSREELLRIAKRKDITQDDADAVARLCSSCNRTGYSMRSAELVKHGGNSSDNVLIRGVTLSVFEIEELGVETGRKWTDTEEGVAANVAVIGSDIVKNLFDGADAAAVLGQEIRIRGSLCRIIGVAESQGSIFGVSRDNFVVIPYQTALRILPIRESLVMEIQTADAKQMESAQDEVRTVMRNRRGKTAIIQGENEDDEGFTIESADVFIGLYKTATDNIYLVTIGVSAISLVVGGIVVMNIMLVSVAERTKEIGLRMAVGARRSDILLQFLSEAVLIASAGGTIGVFAGFAVAALISYAIGFPTLVNIWSVVLGVGVASAIGIVSGSYPAWRGSRLDPVEAMRRE